MQVNHMIESPNVEPVLSDLPRRPNKHVESVCRHIAFNRDILFKDIAFDELIPLAFHCKILDLDQHDIKRFAQKVSDEYWSTRSHDLFGDWQKYCKFLPSPQRDLAIFEGALYFASQRIPTAQRHPWLLSAQDLFQSLKPLLGPPNLNKQNGSRKRKRGILEFVESEVAVEVDTLEPSETTYYVAQGAEMDQFRTILGWVLFIGIKGSHLRKQENRNFITEAVYLCLPIFPGQDCKLCIYVSHDVGEEARRAMTGSYKDVEIVLGHWLSYAIYKSELRKKEKRSGVSWDKSKAVRFYPGVDEDSDWRLEIVIGFDQGKEAFRLFPV